MNTQSNQYRQVLDQAKGQRQQVMKNQKECESLLKTLKKKERHLQKAQKIIQVVARMTQEQLEYHISELTTLALASVFPDPYELNLDFELKRGKSEAVISFDKKGDGNKVQPLLASGGGAVDVASFALRVALWSLQCPRSRECILLDEPFRFLSRGLQERASTMLKELSTRLRLQFVIVTHEETLIESADKVFEVSIRKGVSEVV